MIPLEARLQKTVPMLLSTDRRRILAGIAAIVAAIALADWRVHGISLGGLYLFPMLLAATLMSSRAIVALAIVCAVLRCTFDDLHFVTQYSVRFLSAWLSYVISGLFMTAVIRNREIAIQHLSQITREQRLRNEAEARLKTLVESSPAAIFTLNHWGTVVAANHAADILFGMEREHTLEGRSIGRYMPVLIEALRLGGGDEPFRTAAQAQGRRESGETFLSDLWFSTYLTQEGTHLSAIVVDSSEEMRDREEQNVQQLSTNSRLVMAAVLHEVRSLCSAISVVYSNLNEQDTRCRLEEIQGLETLVKGLGWVASLELDGKEEEALEDISLQSVLNDLRIVIEPTWREIDGFVCWTVAEPGARVLANRHGLMQVFMNLAQNSHRAVQTGPVRKL
jgi:two-component system, LuxR family, sensor kinase FixL